MLILGFFRALLDLFPDSFKLRFSDWHSSIYSSGESIAIVCGLRVDIFNFSLKSACSNTKFVFLLNTNLQVYSFNKNIGCLNKLDTPPVINISANDSLLICISEENFPIRFGFTSLEPLQITSGYCVPIKVKSVACGSEFSLFLSTSGLIFAQGIGSRGQLGLGDLESRDSPEVIHSLSNVKIISVACGNAHSICLSDSGEVYSWGSNEYGQLGIKSISIERSKNINSNIPDSCVNIQPYPTIVDFPDDISISEVACGSRHTACLGVSGELFAFGWNGFGQLGLSPNEASDKAIRVHFNADQTLQPRLFCGQWCTFLSPTGDA